MWDCVFTADSNFLISCSSDKTAKLWEIETGTVQRTYLDHTKSVIAVALNDVTVIND